MIRFDENAQTRLEKGDEFFLSDIYFTKDEIKEILNFPTSNGLLFSEYLRSKIQEKAGNGNYEICASHDIAPFFIKVFGISN